MEAPTGPVLYTEGEFHYLSCVRQGDHGLVSLPEPIWSRYGMLGSTAVSELQLQVVPEALVIIRMCSDSNRSGGLCVAWPDALHRETKSLAACDDPRNPLTDRLISEKSLSTLWFAHKILANSNCSARRRVLACSAGASSLSWWVISSFGWHTAARCRRIFCDMSLRASDHVSVDGLMLRELCGIRP